MGRVVLWLIVLIAVAIGGAAASFDYWWGHVEPRIAAYLPSAQQADPLADSQFTALMQRVDALELSLASNAMSPDANDAIADLERERQAASEKLAEALVRLNTVEQAVSDVRLLAEAVSPGDARSDAGESLARINQRLVELEGSNTSVSDLSSRLEQLENSAPTGPSPDALVNALSGLESRLGALETREASLPRADGSALLIALGDLRSAVRTGQPFADRLAAAVAAAPDILPADAVAVLQQHAASGVPTLAGLRESYRDTAAAIARVRAVPEETDWMSQVLGKVTSLVSVRRINGAEEDSLDGRLSIADRALASGDLGAAVTALTGLTGNPAAAAAPWLADAQSRLDSERALSVLNVSAVSVLRAG